MRTLFIRLITVIAGLSALATAVMVPLVYIFGWDKVQEPFYYTTISLVALGFPAALLYGVSNFVSGIADQDDPAWYWVDYTPSILAWISISITAVVVMFNLFMAKADIVKLIQETFALQLLLGLVVFSWFDRFFLQRKKHQFVVAQLNQPNAPTQLSQMPAQPTSRATFGGMAAMVGIVLLLIGAAIYAYGAPTRETRKSTNRNVPPAFNGLVLGKADAAMNRGRDNNAEKRAEAGAKCAAELANRSAGSYPSQMVWREYGCTVTSGVRESGYSYRP